MRLYGLISSEAEDAGQSVLIDGWLAVTRNWTPREEMSWLAIVIHNVAVDALAERSKRIPAIAIEPVDKDALNDPLAACCNADDMRCAIGLIRSLPRPYCHIANLQYVRRLTRRKIMELLQLRPKAVGKRTSAKQARWHIQQTHRMLQELGRSILRNLRAAGDRRKSSKTPIPPSRFFREGGQK